MGDGQSQTITNRPGTKEVFVSNYRLFHQMGGSGLTSNDHGSAGTKVYMDTDMSFRTLPNGHHRQWKAIRV